MDMFNSINFIKALKESYDAIPYIQGDQAAKKLVADAIKRNKFNPEEVLSFICSEMGNPSVKLDKDDWKTIFKKAIKDGGLAGKCLEVCSDVEKKVSYEDIFNAVMSHCGKNAEHVKAELYLNQVTGWQKVVEILVKTEVEDAVESKEEEKKESAKVETKTEKKVKAKKSVTKSDKQDPRSKSITLINKMTGEVKTWPSYRACEKELYGDEKMGHGTVSQHLSGKLKSVKGWVLYKEEEKASVVSKKRKRTKSKGVIQMKKDENGNLVVVSTYNSITEAAKATGGSHSGICKAIAGTYDHSGGYVWKVAEAAA